MSGLAVLRPGAALGAVLAMAGCAPVPLETAERDCAARARAPAQTSVTLGASTGGWGGSGGWFETGGSNFAIGIGGSGGAGNSLGVALSSDVPVSRDPEASYAACVKHRAGQAPLRPLSSFPEGTE